MQATTHRAHIHRTGVAVVALVIMELSCNGVFGVVTTVGNARCTRLHCGHIGRHTILGRIAMLDSCAIQAVFAQRIGWRMGGRLVDLITRIHRTANAIIHAGRSA